MTSTPRRIGMQLRKIRAAKGLSQTELAKKARVSRAYVFRLEAGGSDPTVGVLQRLAKALGVQVTALLK
jgi:transcriptional regulator with XRE-family HTH domain